MLEIKCGIVIYKENLTLQSTTQDHLISSLKPLIQNYRIDLLSQRLHRLNFRFYTDTLFAKYKSIVGNTCSQIFIDG